ncbi:GNAT family N-acetyltransferase [Qiania dongpingensis]|uniref:GNAT family N-acetyltransferase n=1 Tax=Qiania dongpingensis TaxID=2763669 RepID=A0A7G9G6P0_9FIRM|nr:GNAT family protein [Qiania dongpingensis]QNM06472.1 GNAT family N-acetyltransferase [Qiania dongpingensis]
MVSLRKWKEEDTEALAFYANDADVSRYMRDSFSYPYTKEAAADFICKCREYEGRDCFFAVDHDGEAIGGANVGFRTDVNCRTAGLGYWLGKRYWGFGIGSQIVKMLCDEAFSRPEILRVDAEIVRGNGGSRRVLEKNGFRLEGILRKNICKRGEILDSCIYSLLREEYESMEGRKYGETGIRV